MSCHSLSSWLFLFRAMQDAEAKEVLTAQNKSRKKSKVRKLKRPTATSDDEEFDYPHILNRVLPPDIRVSRSRALPLRSFCFPFRNRGPASSSFLVFLSCHRSLHGLLSPYNGQPDSIVQGGRTNTSFSRMTWILNACGRSGSVSRLFPSCLMGAKLFPPSPPHQRPFAFLGFSSF